MDYTDVGPYNYGGKVGLFGYEYVDREQFEKDILLYNHRHEYEVYREIPETCVRRMFPDFRLGTVVYLPDNIVLKKKQ
jgi:hypothetical protein